MQIRTFEVSSGYIYRWFFNATGYKFGYWPDQTFLIVNRLFHSKECLINETLFEENNLLLFNLTIRKSSKKIKKF